VIVNSLALLERLSKLGGGVTKLDTLTERHIFSPVLGLKTLRVNWIVGYHTLDLS
jgi:hypothetical protein